MKIDNLKDLKKLIELCRSTGVDSIKIDNIEFVLGTQPNVRPKHTNVPSQHTAAANDPFSFEQVVIRSQIDAANAETTSDMTLSDEELLFYSVSPEQQ